MKTQRKVLILLVFGVGYPLVYLSQQLQLKSGNRETSFSIAADGNESLEVGVGRPGTAYVQLDADNDTNDKDTGQHKSFFIAALNASIDVRSSTHVQLDLKNNSNDEDTVPQNDLFIATVNASIEVRERVSTRAQLDAENDTVNTNHTHHINSTRSSYIRRKPFERLGNNGKSSIKIVRAAQRYSASKMKASNAITWPDGGVTPQKQVLEFVHITKTGGTAVEIAGCKAGVKWGVCHFYTHVGTGVSCLGRPDWSRPRRLQYENALRNNTPVPRFRGERWHTPPSWFQHSRYRGSATFTIVRNPYDRVMSEFYCPFFGYYREELADNGKKLNLSQNLKKGAPQTLLRDHENRTVEQMLQNRRSRAVLGAVAFSKDDKNLTWPNEGLLPHPHRRLGELTAALKDEKNLSNHGDEELLNETETHNEGINHNSTLKNHTLNMRKGKLRVKRPPQPPPTKIVFNRWIRQNLKHINPFTGHLLPQFYYVYDDVNGTVHKVIDHVLKYENLHQEFAELMKKYGLGHVKLKKFAPPALDPIGRPRFTLADLEPRTICIINRRYAKDFALFGYTQIQSCGIFDKVEENDDSVQTNATMQNHTM